MAESQPPTNGPRPTREHRWASRQNGARQQRYQKKLAAWQNEATELDRMIAAAAGYSGSPQPPDGSGLILKRGETVFLAMRSASLVEVQRAPGHYQGGYSGFSFRIMKGVRYNVGATRGSYVQGPEQHKITDAGPVVITSQRIVFQGSKNTREWAFSKLVGIQHDNKRPFTLLHVSNRQKVSGLLYPASSTSAFRFNCSLAIAGFQGNLAAFQAELRREKEEHEKLRPQAPALVEPGDAPSRLRGAFGVLWSPLFTGSKSWRPGWRVLQAAAILVVFAIVGSVSAGPPKSPNTTTTATSATGASGASVPPPKLSSPAPSAHRVAALTSSPAATHEPLALQTPSRAPTDSASGTGSSLATSAPVVALPTRSTATVRTAAPSPATVNLCGAPANPWGYNFCNNGALIYAPAAGVCSYFRCIDNFPNGVGYMVECNDGMYSMSGGRSGACSYHEGEDRPVDSGAGPH